MLDQATLLPTSKAPPTPHQSCPQCTTTPTKLRVAVEGALVTGSSLLLYEIFHNPLCGLVFNCGCGFPIWLGGSGWLKCNVHNPDPNSPRCPWCISPRETPAWTWTTSKGFMVLLMVGTWAAVGWHLHRKERWQLIERSHCRIRRRVAPVVWFVLHHLVVGLLFALATGYPYFLFFTLANTQRKTGPLSPVLPNTTMAGV